MQGVKMNLIEIIISIVASIILVIIMTIGIGSFLDKKDKK